MIKRKEMAWYEGLEISKVDPHTIVRDVPTSDKVFDSVREYILGHDGNRLTRREEKIQWMRESYDPSKFMPAHYCLSCQDLDDGTHRMEYSERYRDGLIDIYVDPVCAYKDAVAARVHAEFNNLQWNGKTFNDNKERKWLRSCRKNKWKHFNNIDFTGKTVLDVGSQLGFTCLESWYRGASQCTGIEIRQDMVNITNEIASRALASEDVVFVNTDFRKLNDTFDIVFCMGLLHYFQIDEYKNNVASLASMADDLLLIEMRMVEGDKIELKKVGRQTLPTHVWVESVLGDCGFSAKYVGDTPTTDPHLRGTWVCKRQQTTKERNDEV